MQDDTYKIIAGLLFDCIIAKRQKDIKSYYDTIEDLYDLAHNRIKMDLKEPLDAVRQEIYGIGAQRGPFHESKCLEDLRELYREITKALDDAGILFRIRADLDRLVAMSK